MKQSSIFKAQQSLSSRILCCASERFFNIPNPTKLGRTELQESDPRKATEIMMLSMESRRNSSGTSSQDSQRCSSVLKSMIYWATWDKHEKLPQEEFYSCHCSMTSCNRKDNKDECLANAGVVKVLARIFGIWQWSFIGPGSEKKWYSSENSPQGAWDNIAEQMLLEFAESGQPTFRATTPLSRGILKSKGRGKLSIHFAADGDTIDTIYRIILSFNQFSVYGAVAAVCEESESHQDRTSKQKLLCTTKTPMNDQIVWQQYIQQVESLSPENKVSKFCKEAGFMRVVEVGQYFVTKDTGDFRQFQSVACREYTLPRDDQASQPKGWIQGNMRLGPVLEVTTCFQHFKYGIEIRIWSVNQDNSQSWVRIPMDRSNMWSILFKTTQKFLQIHKKSEYHKQAFKVVAARSKAKAKQQPRVLVGTTATIPIHERRWIDIEPSEQDVASYDLSKKVINLLRPNQTLQREDDVAIEFHNIKIPYSKASSTNPSLVWWSLESLFGCRRRFEKKISVLLWWFGKNSLSPSYSRKFWTQSHWSNVTGQCGDWDWNIPLHLPHWMRLQSSFYHQPWIDTWRSRFEQKTDSILLVCWSKRRKSQRSWTYWLLCTTSSAIRAQCMEEAPRRGILGWFWSCDQRRINILSNTIECNYSSRDTSSLLHSKSWKIEKWRSLVWKTIFVSSTLPKISLRHDHNWTQGNDQLGSRVEQQPVGKLAQQSFGEAPRVKFSKPTQSNPNPICDRSWKLVEQENTSRSQEIDDKRETVWRHSRHECSRWNRGTCEIKRKHTHSGRNSFLPNIVTLHHLSRTTSSTLQPKEENIDFNIPRVPNSMVKRSHGVNVHNLIQKIENHPQRQARQSDLQQRRQFNLFSKESKDAIKVAGNTELCEIVNVEPKAQCRACLAYWDVGIVYCACGHFLRDETTENKKYIKSVVDLFSIPNFYIRKGRPHSHRYGKKGCKENQTANQLQKKCITKIQEHSRSIYPWYMVQKNHARIGSHWRSDPRDGQIGERRPHPYCHRRRTRCISWHLVDTFELCGFRHDADKASPWLQESAVDIASPQESRG